MISESFFEFRISLKAKNIYELYIEGYSIYKVKSRNNA